MELGDLKKLIDEAATDCQEIINENPVIVLSEGDFERLLSTCIEDRLSQNNIDEYGVHTQISHYLLAAFFFALLAAFLASSAAATAASYFFWLLFLNISQSGPVMKIDEYVPQRIPTIRVSVNSLIAATPRM